MAPQVVVPQYVCKLGLVVNANGVIYLCMSCVYSGVFQEFKEFKELY